MATVLKQEGPTVDAEQNGTQDAGMMRVFPRAPIASIEPERHIVCEALQVALVATQLCIAWHAELISGEAAMRNLDTAMREVCHWRASRRQGA